MWYTHDYDADIAAYVKGVPGVRVYGPNEAIHSKNDAVARVNAHNIARAAAAVTPNVAAAFTPATPTRCV